MFQNRRISCYQPPADPLQQIRQIAPVGEGEPWVEGKNFVRAPEPGDIAVYPNYPLMDIVRLEVNTGGIPARIDFTIQSARDLACALENTVAMMHPDPVDAGSQ
jgi:hypothetical protein